MVVGVAAPVPLLTEIGVKVAAPVPLSVGIGVEVAAPVPLSDGIGVEVVPPVPLPVEIAVSAKCSGGSADTRRVASFAEVDLPRRLFECSGYLLSYLWHLPSCQSF